MTQTVKINELFSPTGLASQVLCTDRSPGWKRTKVIPENLPIREVFLEGGNSYYFHIKLEVQLLIFPDDFKLDINNYSSFLNFARCVLLEFHGQLKQLYELNVVILHLLVSRSENFFDRQIQNDPNKFKIVNYNSFIKTCKNKELLSPILLTSRVLHEVNCSSRWFLCWLLSKVLRI